MPLAKIQLGVNGIITPALKVRVAGGLDFPGTNVFSITGVYFPVAK